MGPLTAEEDPAVDVAGRAAPCETARLTLALDRSQALARELERRLEEKTRALASALDRVKQQARTVQQQTPLAVLAEHESFEQATSRVLASLCESLGWQLAAFWRRADGDGALRCEHVHAVSTLDAGGFEALTRRASFKAGEGLPGRTMAERRATWIAPLEHGKADARSSAAGACGLQAACAFPIFAEQDVMAVVELYSTTRREADEEVLETLEGIGIQLGRALQRRLEQQDTRLREYAIARRVQTALLPRELDAPGYEIAAAMETAEDVGGDIYEVTRAGDGLWVCVGDVAGHGIAAGLVTLMIQSGLGCLVHAQPKASPADVIVQLNGMLHENIRRRLRADEFATFTLARFDRDGGAVFAGAHEDVLIARAAGGPCERHRLRGAWLGVIPDVSAVTSDAIHSLAPGDVVVLYTDGITEAGAASGEMFGLERLCSVVERARAQSVLEIRDAVLRSVNAWAPSRDDDRTIVVLRRSRG